MQHHGEWAVHRPMRILPSIFQRHRAAHRGGVPSGHSVTHVPSGITVAAFMAPTVADELARTLAGYNVRPVGAWFSDMASDLVVHHLADSRRVAPGWINGATEAEALVAALEAAPALVAP